MVLNSTYFWNFFDDSYAVLVYYLYIFFPVFKTCVLAVAFFFHCQESEAKCNTSQVVVGHKSHIIHCLAIKWIMMYIDGILFLKIFIGAFMLSLIYIFYACLQILFQWHLKKHLKQLGKPWVVSMKGGNRG